MSLSKAAQIRIFRVALTRNYRLMRPLSHYPINHIAEGGRGRVYPKAWKGVPVKAPCIYIYDTLDHAHEVIILSKLIRNRTYFWGNNRTASDTPQHTTSRRTQKKTYQCVDQCVGGGAIDSASCESKQKQKQEKNALSTRKPLPNRLYYFQCGPSFQRAPRCGRQVAASYHLDKNRPLPAFSVLRVSPDDNFFFFLYILSRKAICFSPIFVQNV